MQNVQLMFGGKKLLNNVEQGERGKEADIGINVRMSKKRAKRNTENYSSLVRLG